MKKSIYFRACRDRNGLTFNADNGYIINFYNGRGAIDLVFSRNPYNLWTITELSTGYLAHNETFLTRKAAINAITPEYLQKIIERFNQSDIIKAVERLQVFRATNQI